MSRAQTTTRRVVIFFMWFAFYRFGSRSLSATSRPTASVPVGTATFGATRPRPGTMGTAIQTITQKYCLSSNFNLGLDAFPRPGLDDFDLRMPRLNLAGEPLSRIALPVTEHYRPGGNLAYEIQQILPVGVRR